MMIIIPIRSICLLLLTSSILNAEEINLSFEVMQTPKRELHIMEKEANALKEKGFDCHIDSKEDTLFLRCNDTKSLDEMQKSMKAFKENKIDYTIIYKTLDEKKHYKDPRIFHLGYKAYNIGDYQKALNIFEYNYNKTPNLEHGYAYALTLMKIKQYNKSLEILQKFTDSPKAKKLTKDIAQTYIDELLTREEYQKAHEVVTKYLNDEKASHIVIIKQQYNKMFSEKQYTDAKALSESYNLSDESAQAEYMIALEYFEKKAYSRETSFFNFFFSSSRGGA